MTRGRAWWRLLRVRWRAHRVAAERRRRRELAGALGPVSGHWLQTNHYASGQRRDRD